MEDDDYQVTPENLQSLLNSWKENIETFKNNKFNFKDVNFEIPKFAIKQIK